MKKNDGDAYAGVAFAAGCQRAQDACGMTDCGQACAKVGEAGDPAVLEQVTIRVHDCFTASKPDFDQEGDDPRLDFGQAQQQQHIPIHRVPDCDLDAKRPVKDRKAGGVMLGSDEPQQQG